MRVPFALLHALREARSGMRRIGWFLGAISMGVAVLVALYGFQRDAAESARAEARDILGGDLRIEAQSSFEPRVEAVLDSLADAGARVARGVTLASIVYAPGSRTARLLQVNAVDARFPAAGNARGVPQDVPERLGRGGGLAGDPQVLLQLGVSQGDSIRIGGTVLEVLGEIHEVPVDLEVQWAVGAPVFMALEDLDRAALVGFGSLARHRAWIAFPPDVDVEEFLRTARTELRSLGTTVRTAEQEANSLEAGFEELARFLSLVGLAALMLGGMGVGSAVSIYLRERRPAIAVLRCLGAKQSTLMTAYLVQTAALGAGGALLGVVGGLAVQALVPVLLGGILPFDLTTTFRPESVVGGLILGTWVAVVFSLLPLLRVHAVSPLAALRSPEEEEVRAVWGLVGIVAVIVWLSVFGISWLQLGGAEPAAVVSLGLTVVLAALGLTGWALARMARALVPHGAPFPLRQGLAGLFRPGNQTLAVVTALGLGAFLIGSLLVVEHGLRAELEIQLDEDQPSLVLFDIQADQAEGVRALLRGEGLADDLIPIIPARLAEVDGTSVTELLRERRGSGGMYRRLYRNTYRAELGSGERVVEGRWWGESGVEDPRVTTALGEGAARVSVEREMAEDLQVTIGDVIVWDVQGVQVHSVVTSIREVEWGSFQPNFYVIFEPGSLAEAPATFVSLVRATGDPDVVRRLQAAILNSFPNVSYLDVTLVLEAIERIVGRVTTVFRSMAGFVLGGGALVLLASLLATRFKRRRESALLKTLGASGRTIRTVLLVEYLAIGAIGGAAGILLGGLGGRLLLSWQFEVVSSLPWATLFGLWSGLLLLCVGVGWSVSGPVLRATPVTVLREEGG